MERPEQLLRQRCQYCLAILWTMLVKKSTLFWTSVSPFAVEGTCSSLQTPVAVGEETTLAVDSLLQHFLHCKGINTLK